MEQQSTSLVQSSTLGERRVYRRELLAILQISPQWWLKLQKQGEIPFGRRDRPKGREWYWLSEAQQIIARRGAAPATTPFSSTLPSQ